MTETTTGTGIAQVANVMVPVSDQGDRVLPRQARLREARRRALRRRQPLGGSLRRAAGRRRSRWFSRAKGSRPGSRPAWPSTAAISTPSTRAWERGVDVDAEVMRMGGPVPPMFFFRDQDGNRLLIVERS